LLNIIRQFSKTNVEYIVNATYGDNCNGYGSNQNVSNSNIEDKLLISNIITYLNLLII